jgi:hypothetical protein
MVPGRAGGKASNMGKSVMFAEGEPEIIGEWKLARRRLLEKALSVLDYIWRWAGAMNGRQEVVRVGRGFDGWYWRSRVGSVQSWTKL